MQMIDNTDNNSDMIISPIDKLEYFDITKYTPCVSGSYKVLFDQDSTAYKCVEKHIITPHCYYDYYTNLWYTMNNTQVVNGISGWRDYLISDEDFV